MGIRVVVLGALFASATSLSAQQSTVVLAPAAAFDSFLRTAATVAQPVATLARLWPTGLGAVPSSSTLELTAAHTIAVTTETDPAKRDAEIRVSRVYWTERVADTATLRQRITETLQKLETTAGPAERCAGPLGPPAYLFASQTAMRYWPRGVSGQPTQLTWTVAPGMIYTITVDVGRFSDESARALPCNAKLP